MILNFSIGVTEQHLNKTQGKSMILNFYRCDGAFLSRATPAGRLPDLSQAPRQKRNDFFHEVITNPSLFAQIQPGSILTHSQVDFQEHSKVPKWTPPTSSPRHPSKNVTISFVKVSVNHSANESVKWVTPKR